MYFDYYDNLQNKAANKNTKINFFNFPQLLFMSWYIFYDMKLVNVDNVKIQKEYLK